MLSSYIICYFIIVYTSVYLAQLLIIIVICTIARLLCTSMSLDTRYVCSVLMDLVVFTVL